MSVRNQTNFALIPEWVLFADISPQAIRLYAVLNRHAARNGHARPGRPRLAELMHISTDTVDRAMKELVAIGAVTVTPQEKNGHPAANDYLVAQIPQGSRNDAANPTRTDAAIDQNESHVEREETSSSPEGSELVSADAAKVSSNGRNGHRREDKLFEYVILACNWHTEPLTQTERGRANRAVRELREVQAAPDQVREFTHVWYRAYPGASLTPQAITGNWSDFLTGKLEDIASENEARVRRRRR